MREKEVVWMLTQVARRSRLHIYVPSMEFKTTKLPQSPLKIKARDRKAKLNPYLNLSLLALQAS
jgi:hypothetical protein